jgi:hypothetical protein
LGNHADIQHCSALVAITTTRSACPDDSQSARRRRGLRILAMGTASRIGSPGHTVEREGCARVYAARSDLCSEVIDELVEVPRRELLVGRHRRQRRPHGSGTAAT